MSKATRYRRRKRAALYLESLFSSSSDEHFKNNMISIFPSVHSPISLVKNTVNINNIQINTDHIDHTSSSSSVESNLEDVSSLSSFDDQSTLVVEESEDDVELTT